VAITSDDLTFLKTSVGASEGGGVSGTEIFDGALNNLWIDISPAEAVAGGVRYRKWALRNDSASDTLAAFGTWIASPPAGTAESLGIGFDIADDDSPAQGNMVALDGDSLISVRSDGTDTRICLIVGENALGTPVEEQVTLNGTTPVPSVVTFSKVDGVFADSVDADRTIAVRTVTPDEEIGLIGPDRIACWLWQDPADLATAIHRMAIAPGELVMFWDRLVWPAATPELDAAASVIGVQRMG